MKGNGNVVGSSADRNRCRVFFEHEKILRHYRQNVALSNFYGIPAASQATKSVNVKALSFLTKLKNVMKIIKKTFVNFA